VKYFLWILSIIFWNFLFPNADPIFDVLMAILLKHIFDFKTLSNRLKKLYLK
tara:strand:- start:2647 stop:2802 length:156 start_codon:yes stop_codon:yes gene_type:complete